MKIKHAFTTVLLLFRMFVIGQSQTELSSIKLQTVIPPSANAGSLGKFGDAPVGNYTGISAVSVPIYSIKMNSFELPIGVSYHTGGVKVEDMASDVGLGWALNAGGTISVSVNGYEDWSDKGFVTANGDPYKLLPDEPVLGAIEYDRNATDVPGGQLYRLARNLAYGDMDGEPDLYIYNMGSKSGKFYFDQQRQIHTVPFNNLKIELLPGTSSFVITDENGIRYLFDTNDREGSIMENSCAPATGNTSWMLSRIDLPDKNFITFTYTSINYNYKVNLVQARNKLMPGNYGPSLTECVNTTNIVTCTSKRLSRINSSFGHVIDFIYSATDRADLPGTNGLNKIVVRYNNKMINEFTFFQSYFNGAQPSSNADYCRLKLNAISDISGAVHTFEYDTTKSLPSRLSFAQDHWGFYNGKISNTTLLPVEIEYGFLDGAIRDPDFSFAKTGVLKRITYPTGGFTDLEYEPNDYFYSGDKFTYVTRFNELYSPDNIGETATRTFVVPTSPAVASNFMAYYDAGGGSPTEPEPENPPLTITLSGNGYYRSFYNTSPSQGLGLGTLAPGTYTMQITKNSNYSGGHLRITFIERTTTQVAENRILGGLRIRKTADYEHAGAIPLVKRFIYRNFADTARSSGQVNFIPGYTYGYTHSFAQFSYDQQGRPIDVDFTDVLYWKQSAGSVMPLGSQQGGSVAYTNVAVLVGENGEGGKSEYEYSYTPSGSTNQWYPLVSVTSNDWQNGLLLKQRDFRKVSESNYSLVKTSGNYYSIRNDSEYWDYHYAPSSYQSNEYVRGWGLKMVLKHPEYLFGLNFIPAEFTWNDFHIRSKWMRIDSTITNTYGDNGLLLTETRVNYYDNPAHLYPTRIATKNSKGQQVVIERRYPQDAINALSATARQAKDTLVARHIIAPVLETSLKKGGIHARSVRNDYRYWPNGLSSPEYILERNGADDYRNALQMFNYDNKGNLLQQAAEYNMPEAYIWGYNNQYPVAKIAGVIDYSAVLGILNQTIVQTPGSDLQIRNELAKLRTSPLTVNTLVSTYTYSPLLGVTSETDAKGYTTYYEYDSMGRLRFLKDKDGKILKQYDYQYQRPITQ